MWTFGGAQEDAPSNKLTIPMGIVLTKDYESGDGTMDPATPPPQYQANAAAAWECLDATLAANNTAHPCYIAAESDLTAIMETTASSAQFQPWGTAFWTKLAAVRRAL